MTKFLAALLVIGLNYYVYAAFATNEVIPPRRSFDEFPMEIGAFQCRERQQMRDKVLKNLGASDYIICTYVDAASGEWVDVYVGYHESQIATSGGGGGKTIHPPENCLPGGGWDIIDSAIVQLDLPGLPGEGPKEAKRFVIAKGDYRRLVYFWYQSRGRVIARDSERLMWRFWDRARENRTDGALIRMMMPVPQNGDTDAGDAAFEHFARQFTPLLGDYLPL